MTVYFVGAGPGDPKLLTVRAVELLAACDACIYTGSLVSPAVLNHIRPDAVRCDSASLTLDEVIARIVHHAEQGHTVVRLHTGDPSAFSTIDEQLRRLQQRGIRCQVVPGVSAHSAAAAALGWELTVPQVTQSVVLTRMPGRTPVPPAERLEHFAATGATVCLYLSAHAVEEAAARLAPYYGHSCPAAVVYRASWPQQHIVRGTLETIGAQCREAGIARTALFVVRPQGEAGPSRLYAPDFSHGYRSGGAP